jgi:Mg2+ and Co2+ transporter CorA
LRDSINEVTQARLIGVARPGSSPRTAVPLTSASCEVRGNVIWTDVTDPTSHDFEELAEEIGFHHLD